MSRSRSTSRATFLALLIVACAPTGGSGPGVTTAPAGERQAGIAPGAVVNARFESRRAIVASFDALAEQRARDIPAEAIPNFTAIFAGGACTNGARAAFPSVTAPGHASIWTGAYGNVNGIAGNSQPVLPRNEHTLLESESGYSATALRAEPLWLSATASGLRVAGHHVTQAPHAPGYRGMTSADRTLDSARAAAEELLRAERLLVMNGYNVMLSPARVFTERQLSPRTATGWRNVQLLESGVPPLEIAWEVGSDSLYALLHGGDSYDRMLLATVRDVRDGSLAHSAPVERAPVRNRELARHFADALELGTEAGPAFATVRLFELSADGSRFVILSPEVRVVEGNHPSTTAAYMRAIGGWYGNGALSSLRSGQLGATIEQGGDGTAELRYMESLELLTRQFMRGSEWMWKQQPRLLLDYFPLVDETDHEWYGLVSVAAPKYDRGVAQRIQEFRERAWALADVRLGELGKLVAGDPDAILVLTGDHGMRASWRVLGINTVLRDAGLLALDSSGNIDLSRTKALSPNGYYVTVNRDEWKGGIVPAGEARAVIDAAERALLAVRDSSGVQVVKRTWRSDAPGAAELGIGGPTGGDLYYELAEGYARTADPRAQVVAAAARVSAGHGYPSPAPDMYTVFCVWGEGVPARRVPHARTIDVAPTVSEWLGVRPPAHATGSSILADLIGVAAPGQ